MGGPQKWVANLPSTAYRSERKYSATLFGEKGSAEKKSGGEKDSLLGPGVWGDWRDLGRFHIGEEVEAKEKSE